MTQSSVSIQLEDVLVKAGECRHIHPGAVLLQPGQPSPGVWWIQKGSIRSLVSLPPTHDWRTIQHHRSKDLVGWLSVIHNRPLEYLRAPNK